MPEYRVRMAELPASERPRERLRDNGPQALSDSELLAILLRVGVTGVSVMQLAQQLLQQYGGLRGLQRAHFHELARVHGMGDAKAAQLKAALEIGRRLALLGSEERFNVSSPDDVARLMQVEMAHLDQEHLRIICLDTKNYVQKMHTVYIGTVNSSVVRVGEVFKEAIMLNSVALIVVHNHPSGDPSPSPEDIAVTHHIIEAGKLLDIHVLDHLVIGHGRYVSMRERGIGGF